MNMSKETTFSALHNKEISEDYESNIEAKDEDEGLLTPPFPTLQVSFLCLGMLAHSVIFTSPLPYIAYMIVDFGEADNLDTAGYRAGWITGMFMIGRAIAGIPWGLAADHYGRKITLALSMFNVCIFGTIFGFSTNFIMAISLRFCIGLGNGFMGVAKTVISEITHNKEQELKAFGLINGVWGLGMIVGPSIGGLLSRPAVQYPTIVSNKSLFGKYPYLLPSLICSFIALVAGLGITFFMTETLKPKEYKSKLQPKNMEIKTSNSSEGSLYKKSIKKFKEVFGTKKTLKNQYNELNSSEKNDDDYGIELVESSIISNCDDVESPTQILNSSNTLLNNFTSKIHEKPNTFTGILKDSTIQLLFFIYLAMCLIIMFIDENFPLYCLTSIKRGGLSFNNIDIGLVLGSIGAFLAFFQLFFYDKFIKFFFENTPNNLIYFYLMTFVSISIIIFSIVISAALYFLMKFDGNSIPRESILLKLIVVCTWIFYRIPATSAFTILSMLINSSVDSSMRGTLNGLMMTAGSTGNGVGPIIGSIIYAYFVDINYDFTINDNSEAEESNPIDSQSSHPSYIHSGSFSLHSLFFKLDNDDQSTDDSVISTTFHDYNEAKHFPIDGRFVFVLGGIVIFFIALLSKIKIKV